MRIHLVAYGTRGDVQPFLALAWTLQGRGHQVRLVAPENFAGWAGRAGVPFTPIPVDVPAVMNEEAARRMLAKGDIASFFAWMGRMEAERAPGIARAIVDGVADAELVVAHPLQQDRIAAAAAARRVPVVGTAFYPVVATKAIASPFIAPRGLGLGVLNFASHRLLDAFLWRTGKAPVLAMRRELGLPPSGSFGDQIRTRGLPMLLAYDEALLPRPADWPAWAVQTGAWDLPAPLRAQLGEAAPDPALEAFLAAGEPPVFLGFGSMPVLDGPRMTGLVREAVRRSGRRAVLAAGWSQVAAESDDRLHVVGTVDHDRLLPACAAAIHHGGAGTTRASLRAGRPTWICSVFADQPFWGERCRRLGVGGTFPFKKLDAPRLAEAIQHLHAPPVREAAARLGERLRTGDGLAAAADWLERHGPAVPAPV